MRSILSKRAYRPQLPVMRLEAVWYVEADRSYDVSKKNSGSPGYVAVRTLTGMGRMLLSDGTELLLGPNSIALLEEAKILRYATEGQSWQFYWFEFGAQAWQPALLNAAASAPLSAKERAELERCFTALSSTAERSCCVAEGLFGYLLADWLMRAKGDPEQDDVQDIIALLEKARRERTSIPEIARAAGMCERSFRDAVLRATGLSPKAYMIHGEMAAAMELLRTTDMTVAEIALCLDYACPAYFSRAFKKVYGVSPQQARSALDL